MAFITDATLEAMLAAALKLADGTSALSSFWTTLVTQCNLRAYGEIKGRLLRRGFTAEQVDAWDRGAEFQTDIGLYLTLMYGGALENFDEAFIKRINRIGELKTVQVYDDDEAISPEATPGTVGYGTRNTDPDAIFAVDMEW
jgi:hypothetical protein